jgi:hypothetical protein
MTETVLIVLAACIAVVVFILVSTMTDKRS